MTDDETGVSKLHSVSKHLMTQEIRFLTKTNLKTCPICPFLINALCIQKDYSGCSYRAATDCRGCCHPND